MTNKNPRTIAIQFALGFYCWALLTAGRNAARFLGGEFSVLSPFRHVGLVLFSAALGFLLYTCLHRFGGRIKSLSDTRELIPMGYPNDPLSLPLPDSNQRLAIPESCSRERGFDWTQPPGMEVDPEKYERFLALLPEATKLLVPGARVNLNAWSENGLLGPFESLLGWYSKALEASRASRNISPLPPLRGANLRLIPSDD